MDMRIAQIEKPAIDHRNPKSEWGPIRGRSVMSRVDPELTLNLQSTH
jgi:hypothetical protein